MIISFHGLGEEMKNIVVLGGGTAGTMLVNFLHRQEALKEWKITVIDRDDSHQYQPGFLFVPFGMISADRITKKRHRYFPSDVNFVRGEVTAIDRENRVVVLDGKRTIHWDQLVITTGTEPRPDLVPGMSDGPLWRRRIFDFYTLEGAKALKKAFQSMKRGRMVVHVSEMPIKCPVAPIEFALLAQDYLRARGRAWDVDVTFVTPLDGAFTKPVASRTLGTLLASRGIEVVTDFQVEHIDNETSELVSFDGRRVPFDLLATVPPNQGSSVAAKSGLADDAGFIEVDRGTLQTLADPDIWAAGDATNAPTSKAGSVAHFQMDALVPNIVARIEGRPLPERFDGHANCFIESGRGQAMLLDFNYEQEPLPGWFPIFHVPLLKLLGNSYLNHASKLAFEAVYWHMLLPGRPLPFPAHMSMEGKKVPRES